MLSLEYLHKYEILNSYHKHMIKIQEFPVLEKLSCKCDFSFNKVESNNVVKNKKGMDIFDFDMVKMENSDDSFLELLNICTGLTGIPSKFNKRYVTFFIKKVVSKGRRGRRIKRIFKEKKVKFFVKSFIRYPKINQINFMSLPASFITSNKLNLSFFFIKNSNVIGKECIVRLNFFISLDLFADVNSFYALEYNDNFFIDKSCMFNIEITQRLKNMLK